MSRKFPPPALALAVLATLAPNLARADAHLDQAINQTKNAIDNGLMGHARMVAAHAEAALSHAQASTPGRGDAHTQAGMAHLAAAIREGRENHTAEAIQQAEAALAQLEEAAK